MEGEELPPGEAGGDQQYDQQQYDQGEQMEQPQEQQYGEEPQQYGEEPEQQAVEEQPMEAEQPQEEPSAPQQEEEPQQPADSPLAEDPNVVSLTLHQVWTGMAYPFEICDQNKLIPWYSLLYYPSIHHFLFYLFYF